MLCTGRIAVKWTGVILMMATLSIYATSVGLEQWVTTSDNHTWGLWRWCDGNTSKTCYDIQQGDSPGYFERVRVLAVVTGCFHLSHIVLSLLTTKCWPACISVLLYYVSLFSTLGVMGTGYKSDHRWKDAEPKLGASFWLAAMFGAMNLVCFAILGLTREAPCIPPHPPAPGQSRCTLCCCVTNPTMPTVARRPSNASSLSIDTGKRITIFHSQTSNLSSVETGQINPSLRSHSSRQPPGSHVTTRAVSGQAPDGAGRIERGGRKTEQPFSFTTLSQFCDSTK